MMSMCVGGIGIDLVLDHELAETYLVAKELLHGQPLLAVSCDGPLLIRRRDGSLVAILPGKEAR